MKLISQWLARLQPQPNLHTALPTPDAALATPLLWLGKNDPWTVRDALEGCAILGATGSGKTSGSGQALAKAFLRAGFGGLVLCCKPDEAQLWQRYCRETNRSNSLIIFGPNQPHRFNFLNYELSRPGVGAGHTENLVRLFTTVMAVAESKGGASGSNQDFWERCTKQMLRNLVELVAIARGRLMLQELYDVLVSAAQTPEEFQSDAWRKSSFCWRCIRDGEATPKPARQAHDFQHAAAYWSREYPGMSSRTRSIIVTSLTSMMDIFLRGVLHDLFCTSTTIVPEMTHEGAVLIIDLPVKEFTQIGQLSQTLIKYVWQRASERRDVTRHPRPAFLWCDEAQFFATATDAEFQSTARSSRIATVYLSQNIGAYYNHLGQPDTHSLMGNLQTKFFHANGDPMTNSWAADLFAKSWQFRGSTSVGTAQEKTVSKNYAASDSLDFEVQPGEFTTLRKGGPDSGYCVEAIAFQGGRIWHETSKNHIKVGFAQR
jgi:NAD(P)-dependent dehydrogenase (short-subunit alcohol dehydrogenase family)